MRVSRYFIFFIFFISETEVFSQHIFPVVYTNCNTDYFALERDKALAAIDDAQFLSVITRNLNDRARSKIKGNISLQIMVDQLGNSCLISLKNETNISTRKLNLKTAIDENLKWEMPDKKVSVIALVRFKDDGTTELLRLGVGKDNEVIVLNK